jgi:IPT/TIG domain
MSIFGQNRVATQASTGSRTQTARRYLIVGASATCAIAMGLTLASGAQAATPRTGSGARAVPAAAAGVGAASVSTISPSVQAGLASQEVDITGSGFTGATQVSFGGVAAHAIDVLSDTEIAAVTPAHANGVVDVVVTTPTGSATLPGGYTYTDPAGQSIWESLTVSGDSGKIAAFTCPAETPYLTNFDGPPVTGYEPNDEHSGLIDNDGNPQYYTDKNGQALGVWVNYTNITWSDETITPTLHCTNSAAAGFTTTLTPNQPISGPAAPDPTAQGGAMDQLLPVLINNSNSWLKITKVWADNPNGENFLDSAMPQAGQVVAPGGQIAANVHFFADGPTLHVQVSDNHGDVLNTSVAGSSLESGFQRSWTCADTAGTNLHCHPTTPHMQDSTIVQIEKT